MFKEIKLTPEQAQRKNAPKKVYKNIGFPVANREEETFLHEHISEEEWNKLGFFEKDQFIENEVLKEWAYDYIEMSSEIKEQADD